MNGCGGTHRRGGTHDRWRGVRRCMSARLGRTAGLAAWRLRLTSPLSVEGGRWTVAGQRLGRWTWQETTWGLRHTTLTTRHR